ncbi:MAG: FAD-dependent oxidoreductase [Negativicutes bacterium]|nr:FAD-dependent oxidoreductase [Negativicutes bacterium]
MRKTALILGGGIAGLHTALQLADAGYPAALVTDEATLGGKLAAAGLADSQSACLWDKALNISAVYLGGSLHASPAMLAGLILRAVNHPNIRAYTQARLTGLQGAAGEFSASIGDAVTGLPVEEIAAGAVILAAGFDMVDAAQHGEYGYGRYRNVVTSLELERLLAQSRFQGSVRRPSDGKPAEKLAFIQCVGSRDSVAGREYCSSICCMFTAKEAILLSELDPKTQISVFYIDTRACGKNFDHFLQQAENLGVRYVRSMISEIKEDPVSENLLVRYMEAGENRQQEFDMMVLAMGIQPSAGLAQTAALLGIALNDYGFVAVNQFCPVLTSRPGVFVVGGGQGPLEISETLALAASAAAMAAEALGEAAQRPARRPAATENSGEDSLRVGVFLCRGGLEAAGIDTGALTEAVGNMDDVAAVEEDALLCTTARIDRIRKVVGENGINRVVVAPCFLKSNQLLFQEALQTVGVNPLLVEVADLPRLQSDALSATEAMIRTIKKAVASLKTFSPLRWHPEPVVPRALVVGGGISGMTAALAIAGRGFETVLVEQSEELGGYLASGQRGLEGEELPQAYLDVVGQVKKHPRIEVATSCRVVSFTGRQGRFSSMLECGEEKPRRLEHGVTVIATGAREDQPQDYFYGANSRVMTGSEARKLLEKRALPGETGQVYAFIQCVGSRNKERQYCSRTCCLQTVDTALAIKQKDPGAQIYVFYRDMRTPGYLEKRYQEARHAGVLFVQYQEEAPPVLREAEDGRLSLAVADPAANQTLNIRPDLVVLATAQVAQPDAAAVGALFHLQVNPDGFLMETHNNIGTIAFPNGGIFVVGAAHAPKSVAECLSQARGVAARASRILGQPFLRMGGTVARVDSDKCVACLTCVRLCPFSVPKISRELKEMGSASIEAAECRGCGICAAECPNNAIEQCQYENDRLKARIDIALAKGE